VIIILKKNGIRKQNNSWGILGQKMQQNKHLCAKQASLQAGEYIQDVY
jgi:hypothetical protein